MNFALYIKYKNLIKIIFISRIEFFALFLFLFQELSFFLLFLFLFQKTIFLLFLFFFQKCLHLIWCSSIKRPTFKKLLNLVMRDYQQI